MIAEMAQGVAHCGSRFTGLLSFWPLATLLGMMLSRTFSLIAVYIWHTPNRLMQPSVGFGGDAMGVPSRSRLPPHRTGLEGV